MRDWSGLNKAQTTIFALAAFAMVALIGWRIEALYVERSRLIDTTEMQAETVALGTANYVDRSIDVAELMSGDVQRFVEARGGPAATPQAKLREFLVDKARQTVMRDFLLVTDSHGHPVAMSGRPDAKETDLSDRPWFKAVEAGQTNYIGAALRSRLGRNIVYTYAKPIADAHGRFAGAVDVAIEAMGVRDPLERKLGESTTEVWTPDGRLILGTFMRFDPEGNAVPQTAPFVHPPKPGSGFIHLRNSRAIVAYHRTSDRALIATVSVNRSDILAGWRSRVRGSVFLTLAAALAVGLLVWMATTVLAQDEVTRAKLEASAAALSLAVAQRDTLLKEIHHRVKNNLQVTSSLIDMQAKQFDDEAVRNAFKRTQQRLYAIGMVHDVLYGEQGVSIVDMQEYLLRLCREVARANGTNERKIRMALDVNPMSLPGAQATALGLCVSEVLVNAFKHAFPKDGTGEVFLSLREEDRRATLVIRDNGSGMPPPNGAESLGIRLIRAFVAQLNGEFSFTNNGGTTFNLTFAIPREMA